MKWIIDTDPGVDDAAAIAVAVRSGLDVLGLTSVFGNAPLADTTRNALRLVELLGTGLPVYAGAEQALLEVPRHAPEVHGQDGFGDAFAGEPKGTTAPGHAVDFIIEMAARYPGELSLLALGPLTNLALAIAKDRTLTQKIHRIVLMGGTSDARGNASPVSEFNIRADAESAAIVFGSGIPITMVPWETTLKAVLSDTELKRLAELGTPFARLLVQISRPLVQLMRERLGQTGLLLCDLVAAAVAVDPDIVTQQAIAPVAVETGGVLSRGLTAVDYMHLSGQPATTTVVLDVDRDRVAELLLRCAAA